MVYPQQCRITYTNDTPEAYFIKLKDFWFKFKCLLIGRFTISHKRGILNILRLLEIITFYFFNNNFFNEEHTHTK